LIGLWSYTCGAPWRQLEQRGQRRCLRGELEQRPVESEREHRVPRLQVPNFPRLDLAGVILRAVPQETWDRNPRYIRLARLAEHMNRRGRAGTVYPEGSASPRAAL
jgi:hypothetical protein